MNVYKYIHEYIYIFNDRSILNVSTDLITDNNNQQC